MSDTIYSSVSCFTCVKEPYWQDNFVQSVYSTQIPLNIDPGPKYLNFVKSRKILPVLIESLSKQNGKRNNETPLAIVDCGVYMGVFSIGAALVAKNTNIPAKVSAYEANPRLVEPIRENFKIHGIKATVFGSGISGEHGILEFTTIPGSMVGGSLIARDNAGAVKVECAVIPLSEALSTESQLGLVKIDIEGCEVGAFTSIHETPSQTQNVFIIEYAPWQGHEEMATGLLYSDWLIKNYFLFDVENWLYCNNVTEVFNQDELNSIVKNKKRQHNTDIVLIPRNHPEIATAFRTAFDLA